MGTWLCHSLKTGFWQSWQLCFRQVGFQYHASLPLRCTQVSLAPSQHAGWMIHATASTNARVTQSMSSEDNRPWTHQYHHQSETIDKLLTYFSMGKARAGRDGSFIPSWKKGSFAWRIESTEFIKGSGIVPGPPESQCSFYSEVGGLSGISHEVASLKKLASPHQSFSLAVIPYQRCISVEPLHIVSKPDGIIVIFLATYKHHWCPSPLHKHGCMSRPIRRSLLYARTFPAMHN